MGIEDVLFQKLGKHFSAGTILFREGEEGEKMYVIHTGTVRITKTIRGKEKLLADLGQGEFLGEMAILNDKPRSATATVLEDAGLLVISPKTFEAMVTGSTEIALRMVKRMSARLQEADEQIENLMLRDAPSRVVHFLVTHVKRYGPDLTYLPEDLAGQVGMNVDEVDSVYTTLKKKGFITTGNAGTKVVDPNKLEQFLEFLEMRDQFGDD